MSYISRASAQEWRQPCTSNPRTQRTARCRASRRQPRSVFVLVGVTTHGDLDSITRDFNATTTVPASCQHLGEHGHIDDEDVPQSPPLGLFSPVDDAPYKLIQRVVQQALR